MSKKNVAPFSTLEEIASRKAQLRKEINAQEKKLSRDFDAYQDDIDTLKTLWARVTSIRNISQRANISNIGKRTKIGDIASVISKPSLGTVLTVGIKVAQWLWKRKKK